jgi:hypothetical protein
VEVPSAFEYDGVTKTISLYSTTKMEKGMDYRVVVDGTDVAGNHLVGGSFDFSTEQEEVQESDISYGLVVAIIIAVIAIVALTFLLRRRGLAMSSVVRDGLVESGDDVGPPDEAEVAKREGWEEY